MVWIPDGRHRHCHWTIALLSELLMSYHLRSANVDLSFLSQMRRDKIWPMLLLLLYLSYRVFSLSYRVFSLSFRAASVQQTHFFSRNILCNSSVHLSIPHLHPRCYVHHYRPYLLLKWVAVLRCVLSCWDICSPALVSIPFINSAVIKIIIYCIWDSL